MRARRRSKRAYVAAVNTGVLKTEGRKKKTTTSELVLFEICSKCQRAGNKKFLFFALILPKIN